VGDSLPITASYRSVAIAVITAGVVTSAADTTAVIFGLPVMIRDLHGDILSMVWVIMAYLLMLTVLGAQVGTRGGASKLLSSSPIAYAPARIRIRDDDLGGPLLEGAPGV
jgi:hypothetical protein